MKFKFLIVILFLSLLTLSIFSQELSKSEKEARELFRKSLFYLYNGYIYKAREILYAAMSKEIYTKDIEKLWYYAAKLDLLLGKVDMAKEDLDSIFLFSPTHKEAKDLLKFIDTLSRFHTTNFGTPTFIHLYTIKNIVNYREKFFNLNDALVYKDIVFILDSLNKLIYITDMSTFEDWILLPFKFAVSMEIDENAKRFYISSEKGIFFADPDDLLSNPSSPTFSKISDLSNNLILGISKIGEILTFSPSENKLYVLTYNGKILNSFQLSKNQIIIDGELYGDEVFLLDAFNKSIVVLNYHLNKIKIIKTIKLPLEKIPISITINAWGRIIVSFVNDTSYYLSNDGKLKKKVFDFPCYSKITNGVLLCYKYKTYTLEIYREANEIDIIPYYVLIHGINFDSENYSISAKIKLFSIDGENVWFPKTLLFVSETSMGRTPFELKENLIKTNIKVIKEINFSKDLEHLRSDSVIIFDFREKVMDLKTENIIPYMMTNSTIFIVTDEKIPKNIEELIKTTGGCIVPPKLYDYLIEYLSSIYLKRIQFVDFQLYPPIIEGIKHVTVTVQIEDRSFSDTMYYYATPERSSGIKKIEEEKK